MLHCEVTNAVKPRTQGSVIESEPGEDPAEFP